MATTSFQGGGYPGRPYASFLRGTVDPDVGSIVITGLAPAVTVTTGETVAPDVGAIVITGLAPTITVTANVVCEPGCGSIVCDGLAPTCITPPEEVLGGRAKPRRKRPYQPKIWVEIRDGQVYAVDDLAEARKVVATVRKQVERKIRQVTRAAEPAIELPELPAIRIVGEWVPWTEEAQAAASAANEQLAQFYAQAVLAYAARQDEEDAITALLLT